MENMDISDICGFGGKKHQFLVLSCSRLCVQTECDKVASDITLIFTATDECGAHKHCQFPLCEKNTQNKNIEKSIFFLLFLNFVAVQQYTVRINVFKSHGANSHLVNCKCEKNTLNNMFSASYVSHMPPYAELLRRKGLKHCLDM